MSDQRKRARLICGSLALGAAVFTGAAELHADTPVSPEATYDPDPTPGDFSLPMPCGLKMVLRLVCVPARSELDDETITLGVPAADAAQGFYDQKRGGHISGSFTYASFPEAWQKQVDAAQAKPDLRGRCPSAQEAAPGTKGGTLHPFFYFIGKYSVSNYQWSAVMDGQCPAGPPNREHDSLPKTGLSWFDAIEFTKRYTVWLYTQQRAALPVAEGSDDVFVRLPTETEWEYAARGGHMVNPDELDQETTFPLNGKPLTDFAWYSPSGSTPKQGFASIGSLAPNPLGLYDIIGNSAQIVLDPFEMSTGHPQGATGGFITKGGSFRSHEEAISPGSRTENRYFLNGKPHVLPDAGLRVALASVVVTDDRIEQLRQEWQQFGTIAGVLPTYDPQQDPLQQIAKLRDAVQDRQMKTALEGIASTVKDTFAQVEEQRKEAAKGLIRSAAFAAEACLNYDIRLADVVREDRDEKDRVAALGSKLPADKAAEARALIGRLDQAISALQKAEDETLTYYIGLIALSRNYAPPLIASQFQSVLDESKNQGVFGPVLAHRVEMFQQHIDAYQKSSGKIDREQIRKQLLH